MSLAQSLGEVSLDTYASRKKEAPISPPRMRGLTETPPEPAPELATPIGGNPFGSGPNGAGSGNAPVAPLLLPSPEVRGGGGGSRGATYPKLMTATPHRNR